MNFHPRLHTVIRFPHGGVTGFLMDRKGQAADEPGAWAGRGPGASELQDGLGIAGIGVLACTSAWPSQRQPGCCRPAFLDGPLGIVADALAEGAGAMREIRSTNPRMRSTNLEIRNKQEGGIPKTRNQLLTETCPMPRLACFHHWGLGSWDLSRVSRFGFRASRAARAPVGMGRMGRMGHIAASGRNQRVRKRGAGHGTVRRIERGGLPERAGCTRAWLAATNPIRDWVWYAQPHVFSAPRTDSES